MKLLYITNTRFPSERAHAVQIAHMCQAFAEQGAQVTLIANNRQEEDVASWIGFIPCFNVHRVRFGLWFVPYSKFFFIINNVVFVAAVLRKVTLSSFDTVYVRDEWIGWLLSWFVSPSRLVYESHEAKYNFAARRLLRMGIKCVCISEGIKKLYSKKGISATQLLVADDGIDERFFLLLPKKEEVLASLALSTTKPVVMYIGGFDVWKGIDIFCAAAALLPKTQFVAIGGTTEQIATLYTRYPQVQFLGQRPYKDLPYNQQAADVLVIPNSSDSKLSALYTSPLKLFAHLAAQKPLVVSNIPSLMSILSEASAYPFTPGDPKSLAAAITAVFADDAEATRRATTAYSLSKSYTWHSRAEKIERFIHESAG